MACSKIDAIWLCILRGAQRCVVRSKNDGMVLLRHVVSVRIVDTGHVNQVQMNLKRKGTKQ